MRDLAEQLGSMLCGQQDAAKFMQEVMRQIQDVHLEQQDQQSSTEDPGSSGPGSTLCFSDDEARNDDEARLEEDEVEAEEKAGSAGTSGEREDAQSDAAAWISRVEVEVPGKGVECLSTPRPLPFRVAELDDIGRAVERPLIVLDVP